MRDPSGWRLADEGNSDRVPSSNMKFGVRRQSVAATALLVWSSAFRQFNDLEKDAA
ncbi:MAG TPA: hypothetical protein VN956_20710 [Pyrinomonadaceae bacterium]|nr:hypothetical protein [Pyrinomonadaceae bacterium]